MLSHISDIVYLIASKIENSNFLSNFISSLIIGAILTFVIPKYLEWFKKPKALSFQFSETNSNRIVISKVGNMEYEYSFLLDIIHPNGFMFKEKIYWHIYLPKALKPSIRQINGISNEYTIEEHSESVHIQGKINGPIYPYSVSTLHLNFSGKFKLSEGSSVPLEIPLYYFFSTEFGYYPADFNRLNPELGHATMGTMYKIYLECK